MANDYFNAGLDDESASRWEEEIKMAVQGATPADACEAIRLNMNTQLRRKIAVGDVIRWIKEMQPASAGRLKSCNMCNRGWMSVASELPEKGFTLDEWSVAVLTSIPCFCKSGAHLMQMIYPESGRYLQEPRRKATVQKQHLEKLYKEMNINSMEELKTAIVGIGA